MVMTEEEMDEQLEINEDVKEKEYFSAENCLKILIKNFPEIMDNLIKNAQTIYDAQEQKDFELSPYMKNYYQYEETIIAKAMLMDLGEKSATKIAKLILAAAE